MTDRQEERALVLILPAGVEGGHMGDVVSRIERKGFAIIGMCMADLTPDLSRALELRAMGGTGVAVAALCVEGPRAVGVMRKVIGQEPKRGRLPNAAAGTVLGDFGDVAQVLPASALKMFGSWPSWISGRRPDTVRWCFESRDEGATTAEMEAE